MGEPAPNAPPAAGSRWRLAWDDAVRLVAIGWIAATLFGWWSVLATQWSDDALLENRDYYCFVLAGELHVAGDDAYGRHDHAFVNPPFALPLVGLLGRLGLRGSYALLATLGSLAWLLGVALAASLGRATQRERETVALVMCTAPCFFLGLHLAQLSGVYFALLAGALVLLGRGRDVPAGLLAAGLLFKPNFLVALVLGAILLRRWRFLLGVCLGAALLVVSALAYGEETWASFFDALAYLAHRHDTVAEDYWKQFTLYAFFRASTHALDESGLFARVLWAAAALPLGAIIARRLLALRGRAGDPVIFARLASVLMLATVALNSYLFFYDAVFLVLPAAALWLARSSWRSRARWALALTCAALSWAAQVEVAFVHLNPPVAGVFSTLWLVLELVDLGEEAPAAPVAAAPASASAASP